MLHLYKKNLEVLEITRDIAKPETGYPTVLSNRAKSPIRVYCRCTARLHEANMAESPKK